MELGRGTVASLRAAYRDGASPVEVTRACLDRIAALDGAVRSVLRVDPTALAQAASADLRGVLGGIPVLVKDNVAVSGMPTTAGSRALAGSSPPDAPLVTLLRAAGAIILGKANLSEWANFRSPKSSSGWSALGGQTRNPHALERSPSGSSSGSAAAVAAGLAPLAIGTETDGSIVSPAHACGIVGVKPTHGSVPGAGIIPISSYQDVAGPMARTVADAAALLAVLQGTPVPALRADALRGARIGLWTPSGADERTTAILADAADALRGAGATVEPVDIEVDGIEGPEIAAMITEFRCEIDAYLASAPDAAAADLAELVEFNKKDEIELSEFGQEWFTDALAAPDPDDPAYRRNRADATRLARTTLDTPFRSRRLHALVTLGNEPAWPIDYAAGDVYRVSTSTPAAVAGYPSVAVPAGFVDGLPVGISFVGRSGGDTALLDLAYAYEQATHAYRPPELAESGDA